MEEEEELTLEEKKQREELLDAAISYMATEAGKKALGIGIDINFNSLREERKRIKAERERIKKDLEEGRISEEEAKE